MDDNSYHFGGLDSWIADAIHSGVSADIIHKEVIASIRRQVKHHKTCYKTSKELYKLFSNRQYFDVVGDDYDIVNDKINATSSYNDGWTQQFYKDKLKEKGITTTEINIAVPDHPDYTEL
tara:strand:+ start:326 stop:685 length:360 start_codon:yes stop_codon:yes gene_type:complete